MLSSHRFIDAFRGNLRTLVTALLALACSVGAFAAQTKTADEQIQARYSMAWENIPSPPTPVSRVMPRFTNLARDRGEKGVVQVVFRIDGDGRVADLRCYGSMNSSVESATHGALVRWRYPKHAGGPYRISVHVAFDDLGAAHISIE